MKKSWFYLGVLGRDRIMLGIQNQRLAHLSSWDSHISSDTADDASPAYLLAPRVR